MIQLVGTLGNPKGFFSVAFTHEEVVGEASFVTGTF